MLKLRKGFTLVELLVVIAIIGILAAIVTYSGASARAKSRDARRAADIKEIAGAVEVYYAQNGAYPACTIPTGDTAGFIASMTCLNNALMGAGLMSQAFQDPQYPSVSYAYDNYCNVPNGITTQHYRLWAFTEFPEGGLPIWWNDNFVGSTNCQDPS